MRRNSLALVILASLLLGILASGGTPVARASDCSRTSTGMTPLTDMGSAEYKGFPGGLYPGGLNVPPAEHLASALARAAAIAPLDASGQPAADGRIVMLSIGMSNATQEYSSFVGIARTDPQVSGRVLLVDGAQGGQTASRIRNPAAPFWATVDQRLQAAGSSPAQVQVIWLKEANAQPSQPFPTHAEALRDDIAEVLRIAHDRFPNLTLAYLSSRTYAGYASTTLNPEPYAYESGFAVRWLIEQQVGGAADLNPDPARGAVRAPLLLWGPYLWADGLTPRSDGLIWRCEDFVDDGTHPSNATGRRKVADRLLNFFKAHETTRGWFMADPSVTPAPPPTAGPLPTTGPTQTPGGPTPTRQTPAPAELRSFRVVETPSADQMWISTRSGTIQNRLRSLRPAQPAWLCGRVVVDGAAEWGFRFAEQPLDLARDAREDWRTTIRLVAADPAAAAGPAPRCIQISGITSEVEGTPEPAAATATAEPTEARTGSRVFLPFASTRQ